MNPLRKAIHVFMESTGLDRRVDAAAVNRRRELKQARKFSTVPNSEGNAWIAGAIAAGRPSAFGKIGDRECCALAAHLGYRQFYKYTWAAPSYEEAELFQQAGVFPPTGETYRQFCDLFLDRLGSLDGCGVWGNPHETKILATFAPAARRLEVQALEPYFFPAPWSAALAGKRVLVVHPFEPSIRSQFAKRTAIWQAAPGVLPEFDLEVIRSPYGFSNTRFRDWFEMLRWLEQQVEASFRRQRFDVALIGCGAAGLPLATFAKKLGAIGIHTGGPTQLFFGIRGGRWDRMPEFQRFFNDAWVRPGPDETPTEAKKVDRGGYW
ncbi:MAG TPA: hypothetical protein VHO24_08940 [Opitutaceae bacterium]|nr:hypothetical protein [Opitutaceae bacterium]